MAIAALHWLSRSSVSSLFQWHDSVSDVSSILLNESLWLLPAMCISAPSLMKTHHEILKSSSAYISLQNLASHFSSVTSIIIAVLHTAYHSVSAPFDVLVFPELWFLVCSVFLYILPYNNYETYFYSFTNEIHKETNS